MFTLLLWTLKIDDYMRCPFPILPNHDICISEEGIVDRIHRPCVWLSEAEVDRASILSHTDVHVRRPSARIGALLAQLPHGEIKSECGRGPIYDSSAGSIFEHCSIDISRNLRSVQVIHGPNGWEVSILWTANSSSYEP
jgi:hypothetical protein